MKEHTAYNQDPEQIARVTIEAIKQATKYSNTITVLDRRKELAIGEYLEIDMVN